MSLRILDLEGVVESGVSQTIVKRFNGVDIYVYAYRGGPRLLCVRGRDLKTAKAEIEKLKLTDEFSSRLAQIRRVEAKVEWADPSGHVPREERGVQIRTLVFRYLASPQFERLNEATKVTYRQHLNAFSAKFGAMGLRQFEVAASKRLIVAWRNTMSETPCKADHAIACVSRLFSWASSNGYTLVNPAAGIEDLHRANRSDIIWRDHELETLKAMSNSAVGDLAEFAALTGLRQGDLLTLKWDDVRDDHILKLTSKRQKLVTIPLTAAMKAVLARQPRSRPQVFLNTLNEPWTSDGFRASFAAAKKRAGISGLHFHDLRGTAATRFARLGLSQADLARIMGWSPERVERLIQLYVHGSEADRGMLERFNRLSQQALVPNSNFSWMPSEPIERRKRPPTPERADRSIDNIDNRHR